MTRRALARPLIAGTALVVAVALVLGLLLVVVINLRGSSRNAERSEQVVSSAARVEQLTIDLETGVRGYVITSRASFLEPWLVARRELPGAEAQLERLVAGNRAQEARARDISGQISSYLSSYSLPLVALARQDPPAARNLVTTAIGKRRVDAIRAGLAAFGATETRLAASRRSSADHVAALAVAGVALGGVLLVALAAIFTAYVSRAYGRERRAGERISRLQQLTAGLASALGVEEATQIVANQALDAFGADVAVVALGAGERMTAVARAGAANAEGAEGAEGEAQLPESAAHVGAVPEHVGEGGWVTLALRGARQTIGAVALRFAHARDLDDETRGLMQAVSFQAGGAVERAQLESARQAALDAARQAGDRLTLLAEAGELLGESLDYEATLRKVADLAVRSLADWCSVDMVDDERGLRNVAVAHVDPEKVALARELQERFPPDPQAPTGVANVIRTGRAELYRDIPEGLLEAAARSEEELRVTRDLGLVSALIVPLRARERTLGAITFIAAESGRHYEDADLRLAEDLAYRAALAIDNARLYERERGIAETLQRSLLPDRLPELPGISLGAGYVPAESELEVGGDWYDVIPLGGARVGVVIGDVVGHGIRAATVMGQVRSALRAYALEGHRPSEVIERLNGMLAAGGPHSMVGTLLLLVYDPAAGTVRYASAGHLPPLVLSPAGEHRYLDGGRTTPLGVRSTVPLREGEAKLERGSTVLLYTDGLVERRGEALDRGLARLATLAADSAGSAQDVCDRVLERLQRDGPVVDDMALIVAQAAEAPTDRVRLTLPAEPSSVPQARAALSRLLGDAGASDAEQFELAVALGDAAANAVEHAYGMRSGVFEIDARAADDGLVTIEVRDFGRWRSARGAHRGRGLELMRAFTDSLEVDRGVNGTVVRMRRQLGGGDGGEGPPPADATPPLEQRAGALGAQSAGIPEEIKDGAPPPAGTALSGVPIGGRA